MVNILEMKIGRVLIHYILSRIKHTPLTWSVLVTENCFATCHFCSYGTVTREETRETNRLSSYLPIYYQMHLLSLSFAGGETLLRRDLESLVAEAKHEAGIPYVQVITNGASLNGRLLTPARYVSLSKAGLDTLSISLDYPNKRHDEVRGIDGLFDEIIEFLRATKGEDGAHRNINTVILQDNIPELINIADLAKRYGTSFSPRPYSRVSTGNELNYSQSSIMRIAEVFARLKTDYKNVLFYPDIVLDKMLDFIRAGETKEPCQAGMAFGFSTPLGLYRACDFIPSNSTYQHIEDMQLDPNIDECRACYRPCRGLSEMALKGFWTPLKLGFEMYRKMLLLR